MTRCALVSLLVVLPLAGCGGGAGPQGENGISGTVTFVQGVDHPYFPLTHGTLRVYEGHHDGLPRREEVRTQVDPRIILDTACTAVRQEVFTAGTLTEVTTEWYAQDMEGNVWKFGEEGRELDGGVWVTAQDSWLAGEGGAEPWQAFPADPQPGDVYYGYVPDGQDEYHVLSVTEEVTVPAGDFDGCLQVLENPDDPEDTDIILYARGVGRVSEQSTGGQIELVSVETD